MNELKFWKYSTVREFFADYNWSGQKPLEPSAIESSSLTSETIQDWQRQTVRVFLSQLNWTGHRIAEQQFVTLPQDFSPRLSVQDFFQFFTWEGQPNIASLPDITKPSLADFEDDLSLSDFSNMF
ncbi:MAG: hypothetical protein HC851_04505 [Acaryochloris sp. RU_4_1]|nr:hypothetical protein [Acaryochloris sp. RU_4_1]NJR54453.1 hypothetical protein [Acaryochloris sp. CRU_2_0]